MTSRATMARALVLAATLLAFSAVVTPAARQLVDGIAAVVGDEIILESEIDEELYIYQLRTGTGSMSESEALSVRSEIVRQMVDETLLVAMARRDTVMLPSGELEAELERRVEEVKRRHGTDAAFSAALAEQGLTLDELKVMYRDDIERRLLAEIVVRREVHSRIDVTWGEVENYYEEHTDEVGRVPESYEVAGILSVPQVSEAAKRGATERMMEVRAKLDAGESFEDLAREYSDDVTAASGGDLGFIARGIMVPEFEDAVFALDPGEVSGVVPTRFGFHIIQAVEKDDDRVHARHILARLSPGPEDAERARARAETLRQMVVGDADFADVAREYSDDPQSREQGGSLGTFTLEELEPSFQAVLAGLEPGGITEVIEGDSGFYVLKLLGHNEPRTADLDEIREDLREYVFGLKAEEAYVVLMDRLANEIHIDIRTEMASRP